MTASGGEMSDRVGGDSPSFACLAIEMSTSISSIAVRVGTRVSSREYGGHPMQSRDIYTGVREVLDELSTEPEALDCIAFGCGPGAFTGLRVAAAVAQALAYGVGIPVARISSLAALAAGAARRYQVDCVAPCLDARMGEAYLAVYSGGLSGHWHAVVPDSLVDPEQTRLPAELQFFAAGPGWSACPNLVENHPTQISAEDFSLVPSAVDILDLAAEPYHANQTVAAIDALPNYIRNKVTY
jgi:tRNA threonylcarbamoyladenosine biosynthesis protein TsaB